MDGTEYLREVARELHRYRALAERALDQVAPDRWAVEPAPGSNSLAVVVKHVAGNLRDPAGGARRVVDSKEDVARQWQAVPADHETLDAVKIEIGHAPNSRTNAAFSSVAARPWALNAKSISLARTARLRLTSSTVRSPYAAKNSELSIWWWRM